MIDNTLLFIVALRLQKRFAYFLAVLFGSKFLLGGSNGNNSMWGHVGGEIGKREKRKGKKGEGMAIFIEKVKISTDK